MLTPRQITAIKQLHWVNRWPLRQIERHLRLSRKTISKYILESSPCRLRRGRASKLDPHKPKVLELLQQDPTLKPRLILPRIRVLGYSGGITILRDYLRTVRTKPSGPPMAGSRQEAFEWMRALLQGAIPQSHVQNELREVGELDKLLAAVTEGRLSVRNKAMAVLARSRGVRQSYVCSFLYLGNRTATRYWKDYQRGGTEALFARKPSGRQKFSDSRIQEAVFALLHSPPSVHGINRSTWRLMDLQMVLQNQGQYLCKDVIRIIIKQAGYKWRKARVVLTSNDPEYRLKVDAIKEILQQLKANEAFFSIDEYGPFAVKKKGGRKRVAPQESYTIPQIQKSRGFLIITGALELSRNQVTHFYSKNKDTNEMIKMMNLLRTEYRDCSTIYLSWDAASWHISKQLFTEIKARNEEAATQGYPIVKTAPLPAGAQFLNIIESVFSGMSRAVIHNSDYPSVEATRSAIDRYFSDRNAHFLKTPKRAGLKIW